MGSSANQPTMPLTGLQTPPAGMGYDDTGTLRPLDQIKTFGQPTPAVPPKPTILTPTPQPATPTPAMAQPSAPNVFGQVQQYQTQAGDIYGKLGEFAARNVAAPEAYTPERVASGQLAGTDYGQYMSPYTQNVIERGQADIERQRQMASENLAAQAQRARAFGGSRQGVQEAALAGEYGRMGMDFAAQQRQRAFERAQQAAQYDIGQRYAADLANQAAMQRQAQFGAGQQLQAAMANQAADISSAGVRSGAAGGLTGLGAQMFGQGMTVQDRIAQQAAFQRGIQQRMLDAQRGQFEGATGAPLAGLGTLSQVLGGVPYPTTTTQSTPFNPATLLYAFL